MRSVLRLACALAVTLALSGVARAENVTFGADTQPNVVSLWSNVPFTTPTGGAMSLPPGWGVVFNAAQPNFIQLQHSAGFGILNPTPAQGNAWLTYIQGFNGLVSTNPAWRMDWQEVYWNTTTNTLVQGFAGRLQGSAGGIVNGTYAATPGLGPTTAGGAPLFIGPTPEPSSMIAFGVGLAVVGLARRRRTARTSRAADAA